MPYERNHLQNSKVSKTLAGGKKIRTPYIIIDQLEKDMVINSTSIGSMLIFFNSQG